MDMIPSEREQSSKAIPNFISWLFGDFPLCFSFLEKPTFTRRGLKNRAAVLFQKITWLEMQ